MATFQLDALQVARESLLLHPLYGRLNEPDRVRVFMKHHVFAVWDFMSLLKRLQILLTSVEVPWMPDRPARYARFINEIVLGEETDEDGEGGSISHFELYLQAMEEVGADTAPIRQFLDEMRAGSSWEEALERAEIAPSVKAFVAHTMKIAVEGQPHEVAAAFFYGREDIIPDMFTHLVHEIEQHGGKADRLVYYLNRHIELDGDSHGPLASQLLDYLCGGEEMRIREAQKTAEDCLQARIELWNGVLADIERQG